MPYPKKIPHGIMFHHFHGGKHDESQGSISQKDFQNILEYVGLKRILEPQVWLEKCAHKRLEPGDLCLTFDDALLSQLEIALPVLEKYHLKAFWFIYSAVFEGKFVKFEIYRKFRCRSFKDVEDFYKIFFQKVFDSEFGQKARGALESFDIQAHLKVFPFYTINDVKFRVMRDRVLPQDVYEKIMSAIIAERGEDEKKLAQNLWMRNNDLKYLSDQGHRIGLHSYSHPMVLANSPYEKQLDEYKKNFNHILGVCGVLPRAVAHPANSYNDDTIKILQELGIVCGFRSNMSPKTPKGDLNPTPYEIAREDHSNILKMIHN